MANQGFTALASTAETSTVIRIIKAVDTSAPVVTGGAAQPPREGILFPRGQG